MTDLINAFSFLSTNIHLAGWAFLIVLAWKASSRVTKFFAGMEETSKKTREAAERTAEMEKTLQAVATNHLPHLQQSMDNIDRTLKDLHSDLLAIVVKTTTFRETVVTRAPSEKASE